MLENITRREKLKGTDPPATYANRHTLTISPEIACSLVFIWNSKGEAKKILTAGC